MSIEGIISKVGNVQGSVGGLKTINGYSAYEIALINGFKGTEEEWLASLVGPVGPVGPAGADGQPGTPGKDGEPGKDGVSPTASVQQTATGAKIIITDSDGKTEATITNGTDGTDGEDAPEITDISINGDYHLIIKLSDGTSYDAGYCRGASGAGTGDMMASTYDPQGKNRDIFKYVDDQMANVDFDITADEVTFADGETFQQKFNQGELKGQKGDNGISVTHSWIGTTLTVTSASGTSSANLKGADGGKGADGVGIKSVTQTTTSNADGGSNVVTVTKTDNTTSTFTVKNGSKGSDGAKGDKGDAGSWTQYTGTLLSSGWAADTNGYMAQTVTIQGLLASYDVSPDIDVVLSGSDLNSDSELIAAFGLISVAGTVENGLVAKCVGDAPSINIPIIVRVQE